MKVSICVAQYNRADRIALSIGSLIEQDYDDYEIIVVNDGSPDPQVRIELEKLLASSGGKLTILHQENAGFVGAMNHAIGVASGEYIAIHGAGDISFKARIRKQANYLDTNPTIGLVSCLFQNVVIGGNRDGSSVAKVKKKGLITARDLLAFDNPFSQGEVMYRKDLFHKVGGYRPYFRFAQDRDLWLRMIEHTRMTIIQEFLYERGIFVKDGVSTNTEKVLIQKHLAALARDCYRTRVTRGYDLVDKYGMHAGLFRKGCKHLANYHCRQAVELILKDRIEESEKFIELGLQEKTTSLGLLTFVIGKVVKIKIIHSIFKKLVLSIFPNSAKKHRT